jgi:hypothetical protein
VIVGNLYTCPVNEAIALVLDGRGEYLDGGIERLREIERGKINLSHLSFWEKCTLAYRLNTKIIMQPIQIGIELCIKNWKIVGTGILALLSWAGYSLNSAGIFHHWFPLVSG